jgi:hypothetical protein
VIRSQRYLLAVLVAWPLAHDAARAVDTLGVEYGTGSDDVRRLGLSARWDWDRRWFEEGDWHVTGHWEASASHWDGDAGRTGTDSLTEAGFTPVFRAQSHRPVGGAWPYLEAGIGVHLLSSTQLGDRRFSTAVQFGDLVGLGLRFGEAGRFELGYRLQHLSNAGIDHPNAGINFHLLQLSYRP